MRRLITALALLSIAAGTSFAASHLIVDALETHSSQFTLPEFEGAMVKFQRCGHCPYQVAKSSAATVYEYAGRAVTLADLRKAVAAKPAALAVLYRVKDNTLVRISAY